MDEALIRIEGLTKTFPGGGRNALDAISANIPRGKLTGLVGPDGSGKTTLIRLIAALLGPSSGKIGVDGYDTENEKEEIHSIIGYMPQKFGLYEDLSVLQNLTLHAELKNLAVESRETVFAQLLQFTALAPYTDRLAKNLSGGMKQKLGLACALLKKPTLLLLDEPSVGVDPLSRRELWKMVENLTEEGITAIWSTAYLDEAERCENVLLLNEGKLLYEGSPLDLTKRLEGRVYQNGSEVADKRGSLLSLLKKEEVIDGVIQGSAIRIVLKEGASPPPDFQRTAPRFEDAFMDILGGGPGGESALADSMEEQKKSEAKPISVENLTKQFGTFTAASGITFSIERGEIFGLLGPNGAGKTTTFRMLCGLLAPTSGSAWVDGVDLRSAASVARARIGYMAQKFSLYGNISTRQNLEFFAGVYGLAGKKKKEAVEEMISLFSLAEYADVEAGQLPLGFKQRLSLAAATMHKPQILFLDEPTSGVDPITRREFWNHINGLVRKGVTVMITTHFMDEAEYCDRIALVYKGKVITIDTPDGLKEKKGGGKSLEEVFVSMIEEYDGSLAQ